VEDLLATKDMGFFCKRCGSCCGLDVRMTEWDLMRIEAEYPDQIPKVARLRECSQRDGVGPLSSLVSGDLRVSCIFLNGNECLVHRAKPLQCRLYPFFPIPLDSVKGLISDVRGLVTVRSPKGITYIMSVDQDCRGVTKAVSQVDWQGIVRIWEQYEAESTDEVTQPSIAGSPLGLRPKRGLGGRDRPTDEGV